MKRLIAATAAAFACAGLLLPAAASALTFSPPTFDLAADPGQVLNQTIKVRNESTEPVTITASTASFAGKAGDETKGTPDLYPSNEERDGHGLGPWISLDRPERTLLPGESAELPYVIRIPKDASPGSYFGAVVIGTAAGAAENSVGFTGTAAALILLRVNGAVIEDLTLTGFTAPLVSSSLPVRFEARVENRGTVHLRPYGEVVVKNVFGKTVATLAINRAEYKSVLPGASRRYPASWQRHHVAADASILTRQWRNFAIGPYTAELTFRYGEGKQVMKAKTQFWVVPWLVLLILGGGIVALVLGLHWLLHHYRLKVIRRYEAQQ